MTVISRNDTNETIQRVVETQTGTVWRPVQTGGMSTGKNAPQSTLIKKALSTPAPSTTPAATLPNPSGKNGVPKVLDSVYASEQPSKQASTIYSLVTVNFTRDGSDPNYGGVRVWFKGYQANPNPVLMASGSTSPITFLCQATGETVVVQAQTFSPSGVTADLSFAKTTTVKLSGVSGVPASPTISQTLIALSGGGFQFAFNFEAGLLANVINSYNIYRNTSANTFAGSTKVRTVPQDPTNAGAYVFQDSVGTFTATSYYYFVTAVDTSGNESAATSAQSGAVITSTTLDNVGDGSTGRVAQLTFAIPGSNATAWFKWGTWVFPGDGSGHSIGMAIHSGNGFNSGSGQQAHTTAGARSGNSTAAPNLSGASFYTSGGTSPILQMKWVATGGSTSGSNGSWDLYVQCAAFCQGVVNIAVNAPGETWTWSGASTSDPGVASSTIVVATGGQIHNAGGTGLDAVLDGVTYGRVNQTAITSGNIDPSKSGVLIMGGIPPSINTGFTYTSTTSSITWTWTGVTVYRIDNTTTAIPNGSQAVTGLSANTTYYFYPYYNDLSGAINWVTLSGTGTPAWAHTAQSEVSAQHQNLQNEIPLSTGGMAAATTSSGSGGGSGGGSGTCLRQDMLVETKEHGVIPVHQVSVGNHLACPEGWTKVVSGKVRPQSTFIQIETENNGTIVVTPTHELTLADRTEKAAQDICAIDMLQVRTGIDGINSIHVIRKEDFKILLSCEPYHRFFAGDKAANILAHNIRMAC